MSIIKQNQKKIKEIINHLLSHSLFTDIIDYFSTKTDENTQLQKIEHIKSSLYANKYTSIRNLKCNINQFFTNLRFFVNPGNIIHKKIYELNEIFNNSVQGLEDLVLIEGCEIKQELVMNTNPIKTEENTYTQPNYAYIDKKPKRSNRNISELPEDQDDFEYSNPINLSSKKKSSKRPSNSLVIKFEEIASGVLILPRKRKVKREEKILNLIDRRKITQAIKKLDKSHKEELLKIVGDFVSYENGYQEINVDILPTHICNSLKNYLKNLKQPRAPREAHRTPAPSPNTSTNEPINSLPDPTEIQDENICTINLNTTDENELPAYIHTIN
jgi:hypothetical protein